MNAFVTLLESRIGIQIEYYLENVAYCDIVNIIHNIGSMLN